MIIKDILKLDSLNDSILIAGKGGINNKITSVSVLEVAEVKIKNWVLNHQLYLTSFYAITKDIDMQLKVINALHQEGASGLIICHFNLFLKKLDPKIIDLCNELDFPLVMAESEKSYVDIANPITLKLLENENTKFENR